MLILQVLLREKANGYEIAERIVACSDEALVVDDGSLYPALRRMEANGWVTAEWEVSATNRRARYYGLTAAGRTIAVERSRWQAALSGDHACDEDGVGDVAVGAGDPIDEELREHLEALRQERLAAGDSEEEAMRNARHQLGHAPAIAEAVRELSWFHRGEAVWRHARFRCDRFTGTAARMCWRRPF